ncbi:hypothetical protein AOLI_G00172510 [Acnodon oligacanthus]
MDIWALLLPQKRKHHGYKGCGETGAAEPLDLPATTSCEASRPSLQQTSTGHDRHSPFCTATLAVPCQPKFLPLPTPGISLHPTKEVTWGEKVNITCSVETQFTGGSFTLIQNSGSFRETKSGTSVTFSLPKVDFVHEGSYYCQYQTRVSSHDFSSPHSRSFHFSVVVVVHIHNIRYTYLHPASSLNQHDRRLDHAWPPPWSSLSLQFLIPSLNQLKLQSQSSVPSPFQSDVLTLIQFSVLSPLHCDIQSPVQVPVLVITLGVFLVYPPTWLLKQRGF